VVVGFSSPTAIPQQLFHWEVEQLAEWKYLALAAQLERRHRGQEEEQQRAKRHLEEVVQYLELVSYERIY
jgi:hypothetical protein